MLTLERRDALQTQNHGFVVFNASVILVNDNVTVKAIEKLIPMFAHAGTRPVITPMQALDNRVAFQAEHLQAAMFAIPQTQRGELWITRVTKNPHLPVFLALACRKGGAC